jgi:hypothetical protein
MNILENIIAKKKIEVAERKQITSAAELEKLPFFQKRRPELLPNLKEDHLQKE